jgi:hypothetical protein
VAIISLLLSNGLSDLVPGSEANLEPNDPANPAAQHEYNIAAVQVHIYCAYLGFCSSSSICHACSG